MKQNRNIKGIALNNGNKVIRNLKTKSQSFNIKHFIMIQGTVCNSINISDKSIKNNSQFITDLWN